MAKLMSGNLTVDLRFADYLDDEINYHLRFTYGDLPILNPAIIDKDYFIISDPETDSLIPTLEEALQVDAKSIIWCSSMSEIGLKVSPYPAQGLEDWNKTMNFTLRPERVEKMRKVDELKEMGATCQDDFFKLEFHISSGELKRLSASGEGGYFGDAVKLSIMPKRYQLEKFYSELEEEYIEFCKKFRINDPRNGLEEQFDRAMRAICTKAKQYGVKGDTLFALIEQCGSINAAIYILEGSESHAASVISKLRVAQIWEARDLKLSVEQLVADPRWEKLFTKDQIKKAKERIDKWGMK